MDPYTRCVLGSRASATKRPAEEPQAQANDLELKQGSIPDDDFALLQQLFATCQQHPYPKIMAAADRLGIKHSRLRKYWASPGRYPSVHRMYKLITQGRCDLLSCNKIILDTAVSRYEQSDGTRFRIKTCSHECMEQWTLQDSEDYVDTGETFCNRPVYARRHS